MNLILIPTFAILNRARGSKLFEYTDSTVVSRVVATGTMAFLSALGAFPSTLRASEALLWLWAFLLLWCTPAWDKYWSAAIGHEADHSRVWGLIVMSIRMLLVLPAVVGLAYIIGKPLNSFYGAIAIFMGLPYYIWGYLRPNDPIPYSEYSVGAILGLIITGVIYV